MIIDPLSISFAPPFFIFVGALLAIFLWMWLRRSHSVYVPHSYGVLVLKTRKKIFFVARAAGILLSVAAISGFLFASLDPKIVARDEVSSDARRMLILFDLSGSMTIGFDEEESPLPAYEKTRMGRAGLFVQQIVEKRKGDAFGIVFFDDEQYVARDFTTDTNQIIEILKPINLVGALNLGQIPESHRIKEDSQHKGTQAIEGLLFAKEFIVSHKDYTGNEIIVFVGDLELQSGSGVDRRIPPTIQEFEKEGIRVYVVGVVHNYGSGKNPELIKIKLKLFEGTDIPFYAVDDVENIKLIVDFVASDMPPTSTKEEILTRRSLVPLVLIGSFIAMCAALVIGEKYPRVP